MPSRKKTIQTTLTNNDTSWKTIGWGKRHVTSTAPQLDAKEKKKTDNKLTPPRPSEQIQNPLKTPLPESPAASSDDSSMELKLFTKIDSFNSSKKNEFLKENEFPALPSLKQSKADSSKGVTMVEINAEVQDMMQIEDNGGVIQGTEPDIVMTETNSICAENTKLDQSFDGKLEDDKGFFAKSYPEDYPPDWSFSPANNYQQPISKNLDSVSLFLIPW